MCGIVGRFVWDHSVGGRSAALPTELVNFLWHRGPDEGAYWMDGSFFFGHRRLSIIDLKTGGQPMATENGDLVIVTNGEIYNYIELRDELAALGHSFRNTSDTEVIIYGYRQWGVNLPEKLIGMFAFVIADRRRNELFMARDRFGEKPLLYFEEPGRVTFSSEMRPLAALPDFEKRLDEEALALYLCLNYVPGDRTMMKGVRRLRPGSWRLYKSSGVVEGEYWRPEDATFKSVPESVDEAVDTLRWLIDRSVHISLRSDVPVGIFLSGGVDSSIVAESAMRQGRLSRAYCLDFEEKSHSEYDKASLVTSKLDLPLTRVTLKPSALDDFFKVVEHADDPLADSSALAVWSLAREAARGDKVVIGGDGGDELFAGYLTYKANKLFNRTIARMPKAARRLIARIGSKMPTAEGKVTTTFKMMRFLRVADLPVEQAHFTWNGVWLPAQAAALLKRGDLKEIARNGLEALARVHGLEGKASLRQFQIADIREYLPNDILVKMDRMSMAHGLEVRAPLLEPSIAGFALSLPDSFKLGAKPKVILRRLAMRLYGPRIAEAEKQGFSIPIHKWIRGPAREMAFDLLSKEAMDKIGVINYEMVKDTLKDHMYRKLSLGWEIWGLMVLSVWHDSRVRKSPVAAYKGSLIERRIPLKS